MNDLAPGKPKRNGGRRTPLVGDIAQKLRDRVFEHPPNVQIGSLPEIARELGVGIVTVQQAARILEHEGLLDVRRGPGGGYYGMRPDESALERSIAAYMRDHGPAYLDAVAMISFIQSEVVPDAAGCTDPALRAELAALLARLDAPSNYDERFAFEAELLETLFRMVERPFIQLICRVTLRLYAQDPIPVTDRDIMGGEVWREGRRRMVEAVLAGDAALARFEANRASKSVIEVLRETLGQVEKAGARRAP